MKSLFYSYDMAVDRAYIIRIPGHEVSERKANEAAKSCASIGMPYQFWDAYNGLEDPIQPPAHHSQVMNLIKVTDHYLTRGEVACALSHISLWAKCIEDDKPLVILEHDAVMVQPYRQHAVYNSICYLGCHEQTQKGWAVMPTPPHASEGPNYHFICRAHAYAIDPAVAKNLLSHVIKYGIAVPLDILIRADIFPIHQMGVYATDAPDKTETTILGRPKHGRTTDRNDKLAA
jgi:glycosyl transferase family 25